MFGKRSLALSGWAKLCAAVLWLVALDGSVHAASSLEERKLPMKFSWNPASRRVSRIAKAGSPQPASSPPTPIASSRSSPRTRDLRGTTVVLDSGGGSVLDAIKLGRRWRELRMSTTVGIRSMTPTLPSGARTSIMPEAYCESMCVFLLLAGVNRYVPPTAHIRVHQIWMGDRAEDAKAATYTAQDVSIIERDVGRLAKYTFEMGGTGDLLEMALSVPPWKPLRELTMDEIRQSNLHSVETLADVLPGVDSTPMVSIGKPVQERFAGEPQKTAEVKAPARHGQRRAASSRSSGVASPPMRKPMRARLEAPPPSAVGRLDFSDRIDHRIEGQQRRGVARLVVAHRLQHGDVGPFALRRRAVFLQHLADGLAQLAQFRRVRADHIARHDRGGGLAERAGLHVMGEIGHHRTVHLQVDGDGRPAQFGVGGGAGVRGLEPPEPRDAARQLYDPLVINVVYHG